MANIKVIADSSSDYPREYAKQNDVTIVPLQVLFGEDVYDDYIDIDSDKFFEILESNPNFPRTSLVLPETFIRVFQEALKEYDAIIYIGLSSKSSGTYNSALIAKQELENQAGKPLPIEVFDSLSFCGGESLIIDNVAIAAKQGAEMPELLKIAEHFRSNQKSIVKADSLKHLAKGGRISTSTAFVGDILGVKPMVTIQDGLIAQIGKQRGDKKAHAFIRDYVLENVKEPSKTQIWFMHQGGESIISQLSHEICNKITPAKITTIKVGAVIGTHIGPGVIAAIFNTH